LNLRELFFPTSFTDPTQRKWTFNGLYTTGPQGSFGIASKVYILCEAGRGPLVHFYPQPVNGVTGVFVTSFSSDVGLHLVRAIG